MTDDQLSDLEVDVNERIRSASKMFPTLYEGKDDPELTDVGDETDLLRSSLVPHML